MTDPPAGGWGGPDAGGDGLAPLIGGLAIGVVTVDADGRIGAVNPAACRILRRPREALLGADVAALGRRLLDSGGRELRPTAHPALRAMARGRPVPRAEIGLESPAGRVVWLAGSASPLPGPAGGAVWSFADVGARRRQAAALRDSEERYRSVVAVMAEGVVLVYSDGRPGACNRAAERILGLPAEEIQARPLDEGPWEGLRGDGTRLPPDEHPALLTLRTGIPLSSELMGVRRADGSLGWIEVSTEALVEAPGRPPHGVVATMMDVTERLRAERELADSEERLRTVVDNLADAVVVADDRGVIQSANRAVEGIIGIPAARLLGRSLGDPSWSLVDEDGVTVPLRRRPARVALSTGRPVPPSVLGVRRPDGTRIWVEVSARPLMRPGLDRPHAVVLTVTDLAARDEGALLRVAVAVAEAQDPRPVLTLAAIEATRLLRADGGCILRPGAAGPEAVATVGAWRAAGSRVSAPITAQGEEWGTLTVVAERRGAFPPGAGERLSRLAELLGRAVQRAEEIRRLEELASTDPLTGLANRRGFRARLEEEAARAVRHGRPLAVVMLDVDHFKAINDENGHHAGDMALVAVAERLRASARPHDTLARLGGDEFGWLLAEATADDARGAAERARLALAATPLPEVGRLTTSAGVADLAAAGGSPSALTELADAALYAAKATGRDRCVVNAGRALAAAGADAEHPPAVAALHALARAAEETGRLPPGHGERAAETAAAVAQRLGWPTDRVHLVAEAAALAGLGGGALVGHLSTDQVAWVRGLREPGPDAPEGARIVAVADAWAGLIAVEPDPRAAAARLRATAEAGGLWPDAVEAVRALAAEGAPSLTGTGTGADEGT